MKLNKIKFENQNLSSTIAIILLCMSACEIRSQSLNKSEVFIKYDLSTHLTDIPIPFDKAFALVLKKEGLEELVAADLFQVSNRNTPAIVYRRTRGAIIRDDQLQIKRDKESIFLQFNPLRPNKSFVVQLISNFSTEKRRSLFNVFDLTRTGNLGAVSAYNAFRLSLTIPPLGALLLTYTQPLFVGIYTATFNGPFTNAVNAAAFPVGAGITANELIALTSAQPNLNINGTTGMIRSLQLGFLPSIMDGTRNIKTVYSSSIAVLPMSDLDARLKNLKIGYEYMDSLIFETNRVMLLNSPAQTIGGVVYTVPAIYANLEAMRVQLYANFVYLQTQLNAINTALALDVNFREQTLLLSGNNNPAELKTSGANHFVLTLGIASIWAPDLVLGKTFAEKYENILRLHLGINVYFRPINKNARLNKLPSRAQLNIRPNNDRRILSRRNIAQRVSLHIGLITSPFGNQNFDHFLGKTSLIAGPSLRLTRIVTISAGPAFLRRSSLNPAISEKKMVVGGFIAFSLDLDFVETFKNFAAALL